MLEISLSGSGEGPGGSDPLGLLYKPGSPPKLPTFTLLPNLWFCEPEQERPKGGNRRLGTCA